MESPTYRYNVPRCCATCTHLQEGRAHEFGTAKCSKYPDIRFLDIRDDETLLHVCDEWESGYIDHDPIEDFIGSIDEPITDLSTTVRETLHGIFSKDKDEEQ